MVSIDDVERILAEKGSLIDKEFEKFIPKRDGDNLYEAVWYHMGTGGKRIRPVLALMACEAMGKDMKKAIPFAAACELLHNWLLVHDDIEDGDEVRRNQPTIWKKYGIPHAINIGDLMSQKVFQIILDSKKSGVDDKTTMKLLNLIAETAIRTAEGQAMDIGMRATDSPTEEEYMEMVIAKTGYYLMAPIIGGAMIGGAKDKHVDAIIEFGRHAGPAFQIADDILDLTEGKGRGEIGRDIKEGKRSIILINCLPKCTAGERKHIIDVLNRPPAHTSNEDVKFVKAMFERYRAIDYSMKKAEELMEKAKEAIEPLPDGLREVLEMFADYLISRKK
jgi:geranylgeranyl pyrophosphate synthase